MPLCTPALTRSAHADVKAVNRNLAVIDPLPQRLTHCRGQFPPRYLRRHRGIAASHALPLAMAALLGRSKSNGGSIQQILDAKASQIGSTAVCIGFLTRNDARASSTMPEKVQADDSCAVMEETTPAEGLWRMYAASKAAGRADALSLCAPVVGAVFQIGDADL